MNPRVPFVHDYIRYFKTYERSNLRSFSYYNETFQSACLYSSGLFSNTVKIFVSLRDYITLKTDEDNGYCFPILYFAIDKKLENGKIFKHIEHYIFSKKCQAMYLYLKTEPDCMTLINTEDNEFFKLDPYYLEGVYQDYDFDYIVNSFLMKNFADGSELRLVKK